jgi:hypothetical protein
LQVGISAGASFTPLPGITLWVTPDNPAINMVQAKLMPPNAVLANQLVADCKGGGGACDRDLKVMTAKALGAVVTDAAGHANTPPVPPGHYYVMGMAAAAGKIIFWSQPITVQPGGALNLKLDQTNGTVASVQ